MKRNRLPFFLLLLLASGCVPQSLARNENDSIKSELVEQLSTQVALVEQKLKSCEIELEGMNKQLAQNSRNPQLSQLENKLASLEKAQEKILLDLQQISTHADQTAHALAQFRQKLVAAEQNASINRESVQEIAQLKRTLVDSLKTLKAGSTNIHKVASGDSLEKIARMYGTTVEQLRSINKLSNDRIVAGQQLKIPR